MHHAGTITVSAHGQTRDAAVARCVALVAEATGEDAHSSYSGRAAHWILTDARAEIVTVPMAGGDAFAGVEVSASFTWRETP